MIHLAHKKEQSLLFIFPEAVFILNPVRPAEGCDLHIFLGTFADFAKVLILFRIETVY
jgi:hypothetical protein